MNRLDINPLSIREEQKPEDMVQQGGVSTSWVVRDKKGEIPMAAFNSERSGLDYVVREEFRRMS